MKSIAPALLLLLLPATAGAADLSVGVNLGVSSDLPDRTSKDYAKFGVGPELHIPVRIGLADFAAIRLTPRLAFSSGSDRVSWTQPVDGEAVRFYADDHKAFLISAGLTVGPEVYIPLDGAVQPYFGAEGGVAWVGTYHSLGGEQYPNTQLLLDPDQNQLDNPNNIDPFTSQAAFLTDFHGGARIGVNDSLHLFAEFGYSAAFLPAQALTKTPEGLDARREAYGWNALRGTVGVAIGF